MSAARLAPAPLDASPTPRRIARVRAVVALVWAAALALVAGDDGDLAVGVAALVTAYPAIDAVASLTETSLGGPRSRLLSINAAISAVAVVALGAAAFGSDSSAVLAVFGTWAVVSGAAQLANAIRRRRTGSGREIPMIVSGGLSVLAGLSFIASSGGDDPSVMPLAGYAALGAVLFLVWARGGRSATPPNTTQH